MKQRKSLPTTPLTKGTKESSFFLSLDACGSGYKNVRDNPQRIEYKNYVESLWEIYKPYADKHFQSDACRHFTSRFWEMYLGATFLNQGFTIKSGGSAGPEFYLSNTDRKIWIEAIAPGPGEGADAVPPLQFGVVSDSPVKEFVLRLRHAIEEKKRKYDDYVRNGIIGSQDIYVIGINTKNIAPLPWDSDLPSIVKAVYPLGHPIIDIDRNTLQIKETRHEYRGSIQKISGSFVSTSIFLDPDYKGISAVIYSHVGCANKRGSFGTDFTFVHNAIAKNKINRGTFKFGIEYWPEKKEELERIAY